MNVCLQALNLRSYGITTYVRELCAAMARESPGLALTIVTNPGAAARLGTFPGQCRIRVRSIPSAIIGHFLANTSFYPFYKQFDLVHSPGNIGLLRCPRPQVVTICDLYEKVAPYRFSKIKCRAMGSLLEASLRQAAGIIAISRNTAADIERFYPKHGGPIRTIYCGCSFPEDPGQSIQQRSGFVVVGTLEPGKNIRTALRALQLLMGKGCASGLTIAGAGGPDATAIKNEVSRLGLSALVKLAGEVSDGELRRLYLHARGLVFPSRYEGFGLPVVEAMRCGCPVIAANNSAIPEAGGDAALYFEALDHEALAEKMIQVATNDAAAESMRRRGLVHARQFGWDRTALATLQEYDRVLNR